MFFRIMLPIVITHCSNAVGHSRTLTNRIFMAAITVGTTAPQLTLRDHEGAAVDLAALWQDKPRVLLFVRHFG